VNNDSTSGESIYGKYFEDENFILPVRSYKVTVLNLPNYEIFYNYL
jgi:hypothetical protein